MLIHRELLVLDNGVYRDERVEIILALIPLLNIVDFEFSSLSVLVEAFEHCYQAGDVYLSPIVVTADIIFVFLMES